MKHPPNIMNQADDEIDANRERITMIEEEVVRLRRFIGDIPVGKHCDPCDHVDENNEFCFCSRVQCMLYKDDTGAYLRCKTCLELFPDGNGLHLGE